MGSKKQQTFAKLQRERKVKEKAELKREKKQAAAARRLAEASGELPPDVEETLDDDDEPH